VIDAIVTNPISNWHGQNVDVPYNSETKEVGTVNAGDTISLNFNVSASGTGSTSTTYDAVTKTHTMHITATTLDGAENVTVSGLKDCDLKDPRVSSDKCSQSAQITAPLTADKYQVKINADDGITNNNNGKMTGEFFYVNFTVVVPSCTPKPTTLTLSEPACVLYHADAVSLTATLKSGDTLLPGKEITFLLEGQNVGKAVTNENGVATLNYDPSSLAARDWALSAAWESDEPCYQTPTVTGTTLGVKYLFQGFQPPINANGSTILTGKAGPVKVVIFDANGIPVPDATALVFFADETPAIVGTDPENATTGLNFDSGYEMRYSDGQYVYNWDLSTVENGTKTIRVYLDEGSCAPAHQVVVSVGKKNK